MICDTHTHSMYSFDGSDSAEDLCRGALAKGVSVLAITDHAEALAGVPLNLKERERCALSLDAIEKARKKFSHELTLLRGCELGQPHMNTDYARDILASFEFDYVIGSLHFFPKNIDLYDVIYTPENYRDYLHVYFDETYDMLEVDGYQTLGHLDYILRLLGGCFDDIPNYREFRPQVERILKRVAERDLALEVNTSCLRKKIGALATEAWVLETFRKFGGRYITIGSDAHCAQDVGSGFEEAFVLLKKCGFNSYAYFVNREPVSVPIM